MTDTRLDTLETPEGRAIYPFGAWGAGYLADAATERRLRAYLGRMVWVVVALLTLQAVLRQFFAVPEPLAVLAAVAAMFAFHYAAVKVILRGTRRSSVRPSSDELLRRRFAGGGRTAMVAAHWCGLVAFSAIAVMIAIVTDGMERWMVEAGCVACLVLLVVSLRRVQRILD